MQQQSKYALFNSSVVMELTVQLCILVEVSAATGGMGEAVQETKGAQFQQ